MHSAHAVSYPQVDLIKRVTRAASYKLHSGVGYEDTVEEEGEETSGDEGGGCFSAWQEWRFVCMYVCTYVRMYVCMYFTAWQEWRFAFAFWDRGRIDPTL